MPAPTKKAAPKQPTDRKPPASAAPTEHTVTAAGQDWSVSAAALDDFELLDDLGALQDGDVTILPRILRRLLGDDYKRALDHLRDEATGRVPIEAAAEFAGEILQGLDPN